MIENFRYCKDWFSYNRFPTREIKIGSLGLGGNSPIRIQSMTNTDTLNTDATVAQSIRMIEAGCELVRITAPGLKEAENLAVIKKKIRDSGFDTPIVADIHFNPHAAEIAARVVEKIRVNPGNFTDRNIGKTDFSESENREAIEKIRSRIQPLLKICKKYGTAMRIGCNHGSLSERIVSRFGDTPAGMVEAAMEFVRICNDFDFHNLVLSMKSSNTRTMVYATRLLVHQMMKEGFNYPIHLGVTEAGEGEDGRIKSAVGIGTLLTDGIGDTIRVSLTEKPENELIPAKKLVDRFNGLKNSFSEKNVLPFKNPFEYERIETEKIDKIGGGQTPVVLTLKDNFDKADYFFPENSVSDVNESIQKIQQLKNQDLLIVSSESNELIFNERNIIAKAQVSIKNPTIIHRVYKDNDIEEIQLKAATDFGSLLIDGLCDAVFIETPNISDNKFPVELSFSILQAARSRFTKTEFISCPSCGRTKYNIEIAVKNIRSKTAHLKGLTIGVMGCIVNGPGEMSGADYGFVGSGKGVVTLFKGKTPIIRNIPENKAIEALIQLIKDNGDWVDEK